MDSKVQAQHLDFLARREAQYAFNFADRDLLAALNPSLALSSLRHGNAMAYDICAFHRKANTKTDLG